MPDLEQGSLTEGVRGRIDKVVFSKRMGRYYAFSRAKRTEAPPTAAQEAVKKRFERATLYARRALANEEMRAVYKKVAERDQLTLQATAVRDWFRAPIVGEILLDGYSGQIGNVIEVLAKDDAKVESVTVTIRRKSDEFVLEAGSAAYVEGAWAYEATVAVPDGTVLVIEAQAKDRPGNIGSLTTEYPAPPEGGDM